MHIDATRKAKQGANMTIRKQEEAGTQSVRYSQGLMNLKKQSEIKEWGIACAVVNGYMKRQPIEARRSENFL